MWGPPAYGRRLWTRYLQAFSSVLVAARVENVTEVAAGSVAASLPEVQFCALPSYGGVSGVVGSYARVRASLAEAVRVCPAVIVRAPSPIAYLAGRVAAAWRRPYAAEIVGDPDQVFAAGAFSHPLRLPLRWMAAAEQRHLAQYASAVLYVTRQALQRRYPAPGQAYAASDAALDDAAYSAAPVRGWRYPEPFVLAAVGALDQPYKGIAILLDAVAVLRTKGLPIRARIAGSGRLMPALQERTRRLGISSDVEFLGQQDAEGVRWLLDSAHLFVLPSFTEGLPRALLEAMARGLPAVASAVGGVPELLPPDCLVPPQQPHALAARIETMLHDDSMRRRCGDRNRSTAREYHEDLQVAVRNAFLRTVRHVSEARRPEVYVA